MIRKIQLTTRQLNNLTADLTALPAEPIGPHLSDEVFFGYIMGTLDAAKMRQVDLHLASCVRCATEAERLVDASQVWFGKAGEKRLAALRERVLTNSPPRQPSRKERLKQALEGMVASWQKTFQSPQLQPLAADDKQGKKRRRIWEYQSSDGRLRGVAVLDWRGDVTFRFTSKDMAFAGSRFLLRWGQLQREVLLKPTSLSSLADSLHHQELQVQLAALEAVKQLGQLAATPAILERLSDLLRDQDLGVRQAALEALQQLGEAAATPAILERLSDLLRDESDFKVWRAALEVVQQLGEVAASPAILERLSDLLRDQEFEVRQAALETVQQLGEAAATPAILECLSDLLRDQETRLTLSRLQPSSTAPLVISVGAKVVILSHERPDDLTPSEVEIIE